LGQHKLWKANKELHPLMSAQFIKLLGNELLSSSGTVATAEALKGKEAVALYFSAHWCPPCRGFTPMLAEAYKGLVASGKSFEIVFVSSDRSEDDFKGYFDEQPWLALPYSARSVKAKLSKKFKVNGIPSLIILDGATGETITTDGRSAVSEDPKGETFPWRTPTVWEALGDEFLSGSEGETVEIDALRGEGKVIGLYFSAHWCPPCKAFTPRLVETYNTLKAAGKQLEIIFVSSDRDAQSFAEYFSTMPWLAIPQGDKRVSQLKKAFDVEGIPTLVLIDGETGSTITADARSAVDNDPEGASFPWPPKPVNALHETASGINETTALCVLMEGCATAVQNAVLAAITPLAEASIAEAKAGGGDELLFFYASERGGGPVDQIRKLTKLGEVAAQPQLLLLDIPDEGGYYTAPPAEVTAESVKAFLADFRAGKLERKQLS